MNVEIKDLLQYILYAMVTFSIPVLTKYCKTWLQRKINQTKFEDIGNIVIDVVNEVNQTFVDTLKEKGEFNEEAKRVALNKSLCKAKVLLSNDLKEYIENEFGSVELYLTSKIESYIKQTKYKA